MPFASKTLVHIAMPQEAKPIRHALGMQRTLRDSPFHIYENDIFVLVISQMGKMRTAAALSYVFAHTNAFSIVGACNVGIAGAAYYHIALESLMLINRIKDAATGREYIPDIFFPHPFKEADIQTVDKIAHSPDQLQHNTALVDMEASGYYDTAALFLAPHQIATVKLVSDHLHDIHVVSLADVEALVARHTNALVSFLISYHQECMQRSAPQRATSAMVTRLAQALQLTAFQQNELTLLLKPHAFAGNFAKPMHKSLEQYIDASPANKRDRNATFEMLKKMLSAP